MSMYAVGTVKFLYSQQLNTYLGYKSIKYAAVGMVTKRHFSAHIVVCTYVFFVHKGTARWGLETLRELKKMFI